MILQITFGLDLPIAEYQKLADSVAHAIVNVPGLQSKIWLLNPGSREAGGIYRFENEASLDAYVNGPLVAQLRGLASIRDLSLKRFEVTREVTVLPPPEPHPLAAGAVAARTKGSTRQP